MGMLDSLTINDKRKVLFALQVFEGEGVIDPTLIRYRLIEEIKEQNARNLSKGKRKQRRELERKVKSRTIQESKKKSTGILCPSCNSRGLMLMESKSEEILVMCVEVHNGRIRNGCGFSKFISQRNK